MKTIRVLSEQEAQRVASMITGLPLPFTITIGDGDKRTLSQNALIHKWFGQIAAHYGDMTAMEVKGECHVAYGVPIRRRDPVWSRVWERMFDGLTYEQQCFLFERGILAMTREMTVKQLTEYMDAMQAHYRAQGVSLLDPEALKYENEVAE
jgi:hypothetical protein